MDLSANLRSPLPLVCPRKVCKLDHEYESGLRLNLLEKNEDANAVDFELRKLRVVALRA